MRTTSDQDVIAASSDKSTIVGSIAAACRAIGPAVPRPASEMPPLDSVGHGGNHREQVTNPLPEQGAAEVEREESFPHAGSQGAGPPGLGLRLAHPAQVGDQHALAAS